MRYEIDLNREPLMNLNEDIGFEGNEPHQSLIDDDAVHAHHEMSPTPVHNDSNSRPRKQLVKNSSGKEPEDEIGDAGRVHGRGDDYLDGGKREKGIGENSGVVVKMRKGEKGKKKFRVTKSGEESMRDEEEDPVVKEMWDAITGDNSEDDQDGDRTVGDDNFIDDTSVGPSGRYGSDNQHYPSRAPQAVEGEMDDELFQIRKKKKKSEKSPADIALQVESVFAELEIAAEDDAELNRQGKPAITKLRKLQLLTDILSKKQLQQEFLDHGVFTLLKNWLEPLPDGSLPNINVRAAVLNILNDLPIDLEQYDRKEQLKNSGLGKAIMYFSKNDEYKPTRKLAKELVDKWIRALFNKSTNFEDLKGFDDERMNRRLPPVRRGPKSGPSSSRPEAISRDFVVRPPSQINPDEVRARGKAIAQDRHKAKLEKKMQQLKASKRKNLQAMKLSAEGRGM